MHLRRFQTYNENGLNSAAELQYWDKDSDRWETVSFVRVPEHKEEEEMTNAPDFYTEGEE